MSVAEASEGAYLEGAEPRVAPMPKDLAEENAELRAELENLRLKAEKARLEREINRVDAPIDRALDEFGPWQWIIGSMVLVGFAVLMAVVLEWAIG